MNLKNSFATFGPSLGVATFGLIFLAQLSLATTSASRQVGVIIPPWQQGGLLVAAGFGAPIVDLRWGGHLIILDVSTDPIAVGRLRKAGHTLIATDIRAGCDPTFAKVARYET